MIKVGPTRHACMMYVAVTVGSNKTMTCKLLAFAIDAPAATRDQAITFSGLK